MLAKLKASDVRFVQPDCGSQKYGVKNVYAIVLEKEKDNLYKLADKTWIGKITFSSIENYKIQMKKLAERIANYLKFDID